MVYQTVTATVIPGKEEEARQWMKKFAQYAKEHYGTEGQFCEPMDGIGSRYIWVERHDSMAAWEIADKLFQTDAGTAALLKEAQGMFSTTDLHFWRSVDLST